jgi:hypothetical protein
MNSAGAASFQRGRFGQKKRPPRPVKAIWKPSMQVT